MKLNEESETQKSKRNMIETEVAHEGIASVIQSNTAITKMAITLRCTTVSPSMPKKSKGKFHIKIVISIVARKRIP